MDELLLLGTTEKGTQLYVSELSGQTLVDNGLSRESNGLYLYETDDKSTGYGIQVLASLPSIDSAYRMIDLFRLRLTHI
jgi:hypothetical protein